jgi:hypothetical protein
MTGQAITLVASLSDISANSPVAIPGATMVLAIAGQSCTALTDAQGNARCTVTVPTTPARGPDPALTITFAGNAQFTAASASQAFEIVAAAANVPGAPTIGSATADPGQAIVTFTPPSGDGGSPITSYTVTCTPLGGGSAVMASGNGSPIIVPGLTGGVTYTCTVSATNAAGTGAPSASSNAVLVASLAITPLLIPTLSEWMLALLALSLLLIGAGTLRLRRR